MNYDYNDAKAYCSQIGLVWLGDDYPYLLIADETAKCFGLTQEQVDNLMRQHLWQVRQLFEPKNYTWPQRLMMAFYFLTGWKK